MNFKEVCTALLWFAYFYIILVLICNVFWFAISCGPKLLTTGKFGQDINCTISEVLFIVFVFWWIFWVVWSILANCWNFFSRVEVHIRPDGNQENQLQEIVISPLTQIRRAMHLWFDISDLRNFKVCEKKIVIQPGSDPEHPLQEIAISPWTLIQQKNVNFRFQNLNVYVLN